MSPAAELVIDHLGSQGDGVAFAPDGPVYVPGAAPGDRVRARWRPPAGAKALPRAELLEVLAPGPHRAQPACRHFGSCGGCVAQHLDDALYADWKRGLAGAALDRVGLGAVPLDPLVRTPPGARRRVVWTARRRRDGAVGLGYLARRSHHLVDIGACPILAPDLVALVAPLRVTLAELLAPGGAARLFATRTDGGIDLVIEWDRTAGLTERETLAAFAQDRDLARLSLRDSETAELDPILTRRAPVVRLADLDLVVPPAPFLQASPVAEQAMADRVLAATEGAARVADLYAGCGAFALRLARRGAAVTAVDGDPAALGALAAAARRAGLDRVTTEVRDLARSPLAAQDLAQFDAVVSDPPRAGARAQSVQLAASAVPVVVQVSCQPATFARDARILVDGGYRLQRVTPIDQFLWAGHVELVGVFRRP